MQESSREENTSVLKGSEYWHLLLFSSDLKSAPLVNKRNSLHGEELNSLNALGKPAEKVAESEGETATKLEIQIIQVLSLPYLLLLFSVFLYLLVSTKFNPLRIEPGLIGCYHQFGFL